MRRSYIRSRRKKVRHALNPMESVVNLIDIMLIFACGLMISIVSLWNINLKTPDLSNPTQGDSYQDMGQVYEDPETGKMYIIKPADNNADEVDASGTEGRNDAE